ncbi:MAG: hypothetical protein HYX42_09260 [Polaromonas sp.]|uniref:GTP pyrophosphokinase n=1 Tax=Polaromonas sp. TaxID=1869339 RepID=UPI0025E69392|nr:hypothetical protein [Polaromonas sp.]MBI2726424.1 hypothetical protein [Polaromonas sp.]
MNDENLIAEYRSRYKAQLVPIAERLSRELLQSLADLPRVDRVSVRAKDPDRFLKKAKKLKDGSLKYEAPLDQIQDQIGARIIVFYLDDVEVVSKTLLRYFRSIETKALVPEETNRFGYVGQHYVMALTEDLFDQGVDRSKLPQFFELQIKTLFQHAWSEAEHDLAYKPELPLSADQERQVAFTAAQAWGADHIFQALRTNLAQSVN